MYRDKQLLELKRTTLRNVYRKNANAPYCFTSKAKFVLTNEVLNQQTIRFGLCQFVRKLWYYRIFTSRSRNGTDSYNPVGARFHVLGKSGSKKKRPTKEPEARGAAPRTEPIIGPVRFVVYQPTKGGSFVRFPTPIPRFGSLASGYLHHSVFPSPWLVPDWSIIVRM